MLDMNEKEMIDKLIDEYVNLQRIYNASDSKKEAEYQMKVAKAKLESFGIITTDLEMKQDIMDKSRGKLFYSGF